MARSASPARLCNGTGGTPAQNGYAYRAFFANDTGSATTSAAILTVYGPPVLTAPADITIPARNKVGAFFTYAVTANDPVDGALTSVCTPPSGSIFPIGTTNVTCSATNSGGLTSTGSFTVTVMRSFAWFQDRYGLFNIDPKADPSNTGVCFLAAYAFEVDPFSPERSLLPSVAFQNGYLQISYSRWKDAADLAYVVEVSGDLQTWDSGPGFTRKIFVFPIDSSREQVIESDLIAPTVNTPRRFIRVKITH